MKKLGSVIVVLLIITAGAWFYLANKFEQIVAEEILPKIEKNDSIIVTDLNSVVIEKFKFKLTFKDVIAFPKSQYFRIESDLMVASYNPLNDTICATFSGERLAMGTGRTATYSPSSSQTITFNRSLLKEEFNDIDITIASKESSLYLSEGDKFISKAKGSNIHFSSSLGSDDMYEINFALNCKGMEINPESKYMLYLFEDLIPKETKEAMSIHSGDFILSDSYYKMAQETGSINYNTNYSIKLGKRHVDNAIKTITGEKEFFDDYKKFDFMKDIFILSAVETFANSAIKDSVSLELSGDTKNIKTDMNISFARNYSDEQKKTIINITNALLHTIMEQNMNDDGKLLSSKVDLKKDLKVKESDFDKLSTRISDIEKFTVKFNMNYDLKLFELDHSLNITLNDFNVNLSGAMEDMIYTGKATIKTPTMLIQAIGDVYEDTVPILMSEKVKDKIGVAKLNSLDLMMINVKENGVDALATFHKEETLGENDSLEANISINPQGFEFKINDKTFFQFLTDERLIKFLKDMPEDKQKK